MEELNYNNNILISVGRSFGSGGLSFACALRDALGFPVFDKNILDRAANATNIRKEFFEQADESNNISIPYLCSSSFPLSNTFFAYTDNYLSNDSLFVKQSETIRQLAKEGSAIFVGRCSDYVLRDSPNLLTVFITEDPEIRIRTIMERLEVPEDEAKSMMEKADKKRRDYYDYYTPGHWGRADNYDICLKISTFGMENAVKVVADRVKQFSKE